MLFQLMFLNYWVNSVLNQFSQRNNYIFQKRNTDNQQEKNLESAKSEESLKFRDRKKIKITLTLFLLSELLYGSRFLIKGHQFFPVWDIVTTG